MYVICTRAQLCLMPWDPTDCNPPGSSVCGVSQAKILVQVAISYSRGSCDPAQFCKASCTGRGVLYLLCLLSVSQFSHSVVSDSLQPHEPQHTRPPCPSPTPRAHPNPCPLCRWCHPTLSSSVIPFCSCPQSFPASGSFQMSHLSASGGQSIGVSTSTSVLPMNTQDWSPSGWTGWIFLLSKGLSRVFSNTTVQKHQFFDIQLSL